MSSYSTSEFSFGKRQTCTLYRGNYYYLHDYIKTPFGTLHLTYFPS